MVLAAAAVLRGGIKVREGLLVCLALCVDVPVYVSLWLFQSVLGAKNTNPVKSSACVGRREKKMSVRVCEW